MKLIYEVVFKYIKIIPCIFCGKEFEVKIPNRSPYGPNAHGIWKRKCPHCGKRWQVSTKKALLGNKL